MAKPYFIGDLQLRNHQTITQGTLVLGGPGTGKTVLIEDRIAQSRQRGMFEGGIVLAEPGTVKNMFRPGVDLVSSVAAPLSTGEVRKFVQDFHSPSRNFTVSGKWLFIEKNDRSSMTDSHRVTLATAAIDALLDNGARSSNDPVCHFIVDNLESVPGMNRLEAILAGGRRHSVACLIAALSTKSMERAGYDQTTLRFAPQTVAYFACHNAEEVSHESDSFQAWHRQSGMRLASGETPAEVALLGEKLSNEIWRLNSLEAIVHERPYGVEMEHARFQPYSFSKADFAARKDFGLMSSVTRTATDQIDATYR